MASGNLSLVLSDEVTWESFPILAARYLAQFKGRRLRVVDTPVERMWIVLIRWRPFFLTYDDLPNQLSLDSMVAGCNKIVRELHAQLVAAHGA
jgi:hypothetical protein